MKKLITYTAICTITGILFSSCGLNISFVKRHYSSGYYVSYNNGKQNAITPKEKEQVDERKSETFENDFKEQEESERKYSQEPSVPGNIRVNNIIPSEAKCRKVSGRLMNWKEKSIEEPTIQIKNSLLGIKKMVTTVPEREGLSLFWIVILVILALWALGFLAFGLGDFIHILLLVALVLLILWLLRII